MEAINQTALMDDAIEEHADPRQSVVGGDLNIDYPKNKCIHQLFQEQAKDTPDRIAVQVDDRYLTYAQLEAKSNQFARYLKARGVKPETFVGVCLNRSLEIIIAIMSILKAGGAYVPIDPDYPKDRIKFMLTDSDCLLLITQTSVASILPESGTELVCYDKILPEIESEAALEVDSAALPDSLAYLIYTSGSTGTPKGVMIEHRHVVRLLFNEKFQFDFSEEDIWSIFSSFCFDVSVWEMFGAILYGGKAVIIPKETTRDPRALADIIRKEKVTVVNQTPSAFYNLIPRLMEIPRKELAVRYVIFAGEKLNLKKLDAIQQHLSYTKLVNMYGITETTVHVTYKEVTRESIVEGFSNIGKPIPTLKIYIFDQNLQLLPVGVKGELCVSGIGVARGYLNRDKLTREKFIPNPLNPKEIIYRSGDLACVRRNGELEYFGRMDNQIQLRGFRIELGEIEAALTRLEEVDDGLVICDEDDDGDHRIVAYIVPAGKKITANIIRRNLAKQLPDYMIPSFFIAIDRLPLTSNGKLDQKRLPPPKLENIFVDRYTPPENSFERRLAEIWGNVLNIDGGKIGRRYNFFEIGGHSLAAVTMAQQMREEFRKAVTIKHIYEHPVLSDLSRAMAHLDHIEIEPLQEDDHEIVPASVTLPLTTSQLIYWITQFLFRMKYSNVCEMYNLEGAFDVSSFREALNIVASRHDSLWHSFSTKRPMVHIRKPAQCEVGLVDFSTENEKGREETLRSLILKSLHAPFNLSHPPHFRLKIIKKKTHQHLLLVSFPHILSDAVSLNAFVEELFDVYGSIQEKRPTDIPLRKTTSEKIIQKEIDYFNSENFKNDIAFWREKLEDQEYMEFSEDLFLPFGKRSGRKLLAKIKLDENILEDLQKISIQNNTSIQVIILALIHAALYTVSKKSDISTAMVCDIRGVYAYPPVSYLNSAIIPVRSILTEETKYIDLISHTKWYLVDALNHVQLPGPFLFSTPRFITQALTKAGFYKLLALLFANFSAWRYRKAGVNQDSLRKLITYLISMLALLRTVRKKGGARRTAFPIAFNVLPDFYEDKVLWCGTNLKVFNVHDRELTMNPKVYEEKSRFQDAIALNIDLLRDTHEDAYLYLWGGWFNDKAFARLKKAFLKHLERMVENPGNSILKGDFHE